HDLRGIDDLLPLDLDAADGKKRLKHRCHKRFQLTENAFALIRPISAGPLKIDAKSMGCIACAVFNARPAKLGKIENISMGGLMFRYVESRTQLSEVPALDILLADCGFYLANIPYKTLSDVAVHEDLPGNPIEMRQIRLQFQKLNATQHTELKNFIINHSTESGDINVNE
ncbi:MAG: hypothetical protein PVI13_05880, partial [Desulfobacterales bacterium]